MRDYLQILQQERVEEKRVHASKRAFYRKFEYPQLESHKKLKDSGPVNYQRLMDAIDYYLQTTGFGFTITQEELRDHLMKALLPIVYGKVDLLTHINDIVERYGVKNMSGVFAAVLPRREGKTKVTNIVGGSFVVSQPSTSLISYNIGSRQARMWLDGVIEVMQVFKEHPIFGWQVVGMDRRERIIIQTNMGTTNSVFSYPGSTNGTGNIGPGRFLHTVYTRAHTCTHTHTSVKRGRWE